MVNKNYIILGLVFSIMLIGFVSAADTVYANNFLDNIFGWFGNLFSGGETFAVVSYSSQCSIPSCPSGYSETSKDCDNTANTCTRYCTSNTGTCANSWSTWWSGAVPLSKSSTTGTRTTSSTSTSQCYRSSGSLTYQVTDWWLLYGASSVTLNYAPGSSKTINAKSTTAQTVSFSNIYAGIGDGSPISRPWSVAFTGGSVNSATGSVSLTVDSSPLNYATTTKQCSYTCDKNSECGSNGNIGSPVCSGNDVVQPYRSYICSSYTCSSSDSMNFVQTCPNGCSNGACIAAQCNTNADCGTDGFVPGTDTCSGNDLMGSYKTFTCSASKQCSNSVSTVKQKTCTNGCTNNACIQSCTEGDIILAAGNYQICHGGTYSKVTDLVLLSPAEQAEVMKMINDLNASIEQKKQIIADLTTNLNGQIIMIDSLNATIQEKAAIISSLQSNISQQVILINSLQLNLNNKIAMVDALTQDVAIQAEYIKQLELTQAQQVIAIEGLTQNIAEQAVMINVLTSNLATKIALVDQLTANNAEQQALINALQLSLSDQQAITSQLQSTVANDLETIRNLNMNLAEQTAYISTLHLTNQQLSEIITGLNLNLVDSATLIQGLNLTIQDDAEIIRNLKLSLNDEATLINDLQLEIADEVTLIANLKLSLADEQLLVNKLYTTIAEQQEILAKLEAEKAKFDVRNIWDKYQLQIIVAAGLLILLVLFSGGRKR